MTPEEDPLNGAKGCVNALLISVPLLVLIYLLATRVNWSSPTAGAVIATTLFAALYGYHRSLRKR